MIIGFLSNANLGRVFITIGEGGREEGLNTLSFIRKDPFDVGGKGLHILANGLTDDLSDRSIHSKGSNPCVQIHIEEHFSHIFAFFLFFRNTTNSCYQSRF